MSAPLCKDCKHFLLKQEWCGRAPKPDLVYGAVRFYLANSERVSGGACGPEGKLFEPR